MGLVQHLRRCGTRPRFACFAPHSSISIRRSHEGRCARAPLSFLPPRREFCSVEEGCNVQQLTLANLGFKDEDKDDDEVGVEAIRAPVREIARGLERRIREQPQCNVSAPRSAMPSAMPSPEEMKQAALDVSNILAGIAGMQLSRPKKLAGDQVAAPTAAALKQVAVEEEEEEEEEEEAKAELEVTLSAMEMEEPAGQTMMPSHPWPEWLEFLVDIHARGYFEGSEQGAEENKHLFESYAAVRHAVCAFGRTHTDIFRSLSRKDLRVVANYGCPDLERKASNASKRLRGHFGISEGEVCQHCRLKMSCPRAFLAPPTKLPMNTLDVLRIITGFATNVWPEADCFTSYPKDLETSVCNLLREILMFGSLPRDSAVDEEVLTERSPLESVQSGRKAKNSLPVEEKPGDWTCPNCEFLNFNRNRRCRECRVFRPQLEQKVLLGDWQCSKCRYLNFSKNRYCRECNVERPTNVKWTGGERLPDAHPTDKLQERKYEASEDEGVLERALINSAEASDTESDANFSEEEERALSQGLSNAASRRVSKATFRWNKVEEEEESSSANPSKGNKVKNAPLKTFKRLKPRSSRKQ